MDAYQLVNELNRYNVMPNLGISAKTGRLYMRSNHQIYRQVDWAVFKNGVPKMVTRNS